MCYTEIEMTEYLIPDAELNISEKQNYRGELRNVLAIYLFNLHNHTSVLLNDRSTNCSTTRSSPLTRPTPATAAIPTRGG